VDGVMQTSGGFVYLLHYERPISAQHTSQHYIGWAYHLASRMQQHMTERGANFTRVAHNRGITFELAAVWPGNRSYERAIKNKRMGWRLCPICRRARRRQQGGQLPLDLPAWDAALL
jgi:predicted GIY-YIG superfamily endonuclease